MNVVFRNSMTVQVLEPVATSQTFLDPDKLIFPSELTTLSVNLFTLVISTAYELVHKPLVIS